MNSKVNLYEVYKQVKGRTRGKHCQTTIAIARRAAEAAKAILSDPTVEAVARFRALEREWSMRPDVRSNHVVLADRFYDAIVSRSYVIERPYIKNFSCGHNPAQGYVYCLKSSDKPDCLKIGATAMAMEKRIAKFKGRHQLDDLEVAFSILVAEPFRVEDLVHKAFKDLRIARGEEWFQVKLRQAVAQIRSASERVKAEALVCG